jgi:hypothetical protein
MKIITIEIDEKGEASVDLEGFQGKGCHAIQEGFAIALGGSQTHIERKREFNAPSIEKKQIKLTR